MSTKTRYQLRKEARNRKILEDFNSMMAEPGSMVTAVEDVLAERYEVSLFTIQEIRRRARGAEPSHVRYQTKR